MLLTGLYWVELVCTGLYRSVPRCRSLSCGVLVCTGLYRGVEVFPVVYWSVLVCTNLYRGVEVFPVVYWSVLWCTGVYRSVWVCTVVYWHCCHRKRSQEDDRSIVALQNLVQWVYCHTCAKADHSLKQETVSTQFRIGDLLRVK